MIVVVDLTIEKALIDDIDFFYNRGVRCPLRGPDYYSTGP